MLNIEEIFHQRTCYKFLNKPIDEKILRQIYDLMKLGPTSFNSFPIRLLFVSSTAEKERLYKCLMPVNVDKSKTAPVSAIFAYDTKFYDHFNKLFPHNPQVRDIFTNSANLTLETAERNSALQGAYFMIIARSMGLDCGPMSGFNAEAVNQEFFAGTSYVVNFICNLGYKDGENPFPRLPRFEFDECCRII